MKRQTGSGIGATIRLALQQYQTGQFEQSQKNLRRVLSVQPNNADANHLLGLLALHAGKCEAAARHISKTIRANPNIALAHNNLGEAYRSQELFEKASECYRKAISIEPKFAHAYNNLAVVLLELDQADEAMRCLQEAVAIEPRNPMILTNFGNAHKARGEMDQAMASYRKAIALAPSHIEAHNNLGSALIELGKSQEAVVTLKRALTHSPQSAKCHANLGVALQDLGDQNGAASSYRTALRIDPTNVTALMGLGDVDLTEGRLNDAVQRYNEATRVSTEDCDAHSKLATALTARGDIDDALASHNKALALEPKNPTAHLGYGGTLLALGRIDDAIQCFRNAIGIDPACADAHRTLSFARKHTSIDDDVIAMTNLYKNQELSDRDRMSLGFGLAKAYEDVKDYDQAFEFLAEANRLKRASVVYDNEERRKFFSRITETFSHRYFADLTEGGSNDETPIFIVGMPRSGTSLMEQILASHSAVFGAGELNEISRLTNAIERDAMGRAFPEGVPHLEAAKRRELGELYVREARRRAGEASRVVDKMPENFVGVGFVKTILPNARIIHCRRNPMDTCLSIFKNFFARGHPYSYDLKDLGHFYNLYLDLMAHWREVLPDELYELDYEQLVSNQETETRKLLEFCGLPWEEACLQFQKTERRVYTASAAQVRRPIYKDSVALWKRYGDHLKPLLDVLGEQPQTDRIT